MSPSPLTEAAPSVGPLAKVCSNDLHVDRVNSKLIFILLIIQENNPAVAVGGNEGEQLESLGDVGKVALKRAVEVKEGGIKGVKRSDSLTKDEKTENNTKERERSANNGRTRRLVQRGETGLKRRHTVGGTRDFDKVKEDAPAYIHQVLD